MEFVVLDAAGNKVSNWQGVLQVKIHSKGYAAPYRADGRVDCAHGSGRMALHQSHSDVTEFVKISDATPEGTSGAQNQPDSPRSSLLKSPDGEVTELECEIAADFLEKPIRAAGLRSKVVDFS